LTHCHITPVSPAALLRSSAFSGPALREIVPTLVRHLFYPLLCPPFLPFKSALLRLQPGKTICSLGLRLAGPAVIVANPTNRHVKLLVTLSVTPPNNLCRICVLYPNMVITAKARNRWSLRWPKPRSHQGRCRWHHSQQICGRFSSLQSDTIMRKLSQPRRRPQNNYSPHHSR
jgi:hypothetical protein